MRFKPVIIIRLLAFCWLLLTWNSSRAAETGSPLTEWLNGQTNIHTWSADFTQTRLLKTFTQPLTAKGHFWFATPNNFRWEITDPTPTIAVRNAEALTVIYPRLKRAERYALTGTPAGPWKDMLALLETGFPRSRAEVESRFGIISQSISNGVGQVTLQPRSAAARRLMPEIKITFATNDLTLRSTEMQFADGSRMRNDFTNQMLNPKLDADLFTPKLDKDYKLVEPLKTK
jgi:outer membrane lipoprotein-sorting protein